MAHLASQLALRSPLSSLSEAGIMGEEGLLVLMWDSGDPNSGPHVSPAG